MSTKQERLQSAPGLAGLPSHEFLDDHVFSSSAGPQLEQGIELVESPCYPGRTSCRGEGASRRIKMRDLAALDIATPAEARAGSLLWPIDGDGPSLLRLEIGGNKYVVSLKMKESGEIPLRPVDGFLRYYRQALPTLLVDERSHSLERAAGIDAPCAFKHKDSIGLAVGRAGDIVFVDLKGSALKFSSSDLISTFTTWEIGEVDAAGFIGALASPTT